MKIVGLITEYNPFHNGHLYHMEKSKADSGADFCVVLMSGSFVQRGAPAIYDKYVRAAMALNSGADLVLEMPVSFSSASAREFAAYGVSLLSALGVVDTISFGSECGNLSELHKIAEILTEEPKEYAQALRQHVREGMTFPEARTQALSSYISPESHDILRSPNNILGIEYCRAALELNSSVSLHTIIRKGNGYHDISTDSSLSSATAIRRGIESRNSCTQELEATDLKKLVPAFVFEQINRDTPLFINDFSALLNYRIQMEEDFLSMEKIADMTPELAARIRKTSLSPDTFENRISELKSRQITYTRVSRALLHLLLNICEEDISRFKTEGYASYARVLGFRKSAAPLLSFIKANSSVPLISKLADASGYLSETGKLMLEQEIRSSHLYSSVKKEKGCAFKNEYTQPIIII